MMRQMKRLAKNLIFVLGLFTSIACLSRFRRGIQEIVLPTPRSVDGDRRLDGQGERRL